MSDAPVPVEAAGQVAHFEIDSSTIPDGLFDDEHISTVGDYKVVHAGIECPRCGSDVFYHPESIIPPNTVQCFNCQWSAFGYAWWENRSITDFVGGDQS